MGRSLLSHFLVLSQSSPRFTPSLYLSSRSFSAFGSNHSKAHSIFRLHRSSIGNSSRCCCSISVTEPAASERPPSSVKQRIVSGVQPTGSIHLGNYLGAIKNWISLQDTYDTLFFIVDLHAITLPYDTQQLSKATRNTAAIYLACGIDTSKASVFVQSHVRAHVELMWLLSSAAPIGWLNRMIQFKEKSRKAVRLWLYDISVFFSKLLAYISYGKRDVFFKSLLCIARNTLRPCQWKGDENVGVALLTYPVLMASDILLYQSDLVPVGEDQKQHLELTRELAERVNYLYGGRKWKKLGGRGGNIFKVDFCPYSYLISDIRYLVLLEMVLNFDPNCRFLSHLYLQLVRGLCPSLMVFLRCPNLLLLTSRESIFSTPKIDALFFGFIACSNREQDKTLQNGLIFRFYNEVVKCQQYSYLVSCGLHRLEFDNPERPECNNLLTVYQLVSGKTKEEVKQECENMNWGTFKILLADALVEHLHPIQVRYNEIVSDSAYLDEVLAEGASKASSIADVTLNNVYQAMGFFRR
ncbi:Tryptophan--tRNA ligase, chloroplastic/mitochondrial, partial [Cucurbita argyrosperma subsp. argyrosperma]